jgi:arabinofuranosyltransferase
MLLAIALRVAWLGDDAYITLRTVENWCSGHGLRWNLVDRVQTFTHPLWMLCLLLIKSAGAPLHSGAIVLGLLFSGSALAILAQGAVRAGRCGQPAARLAVADAARADGAARGPSV